MLAKYLYDSQNGKQITFTALIKSVIMELVRRAFAPSSRLPLTPLYVHRREPLRSSSSRFTTPTR
mgnify:FL=1